MNSLDRESRRMLKEEKIDPDRWIASIDKNLHFQPCETCIAYDNWRNSRASGKLLDPCDTCISDSLYKNTFGDQSTFKARIREMLYGS